MDGPRGVYYYCRCYHPGCCWHDSGFLNPLSGSSLSFPFYSGFSFSLLFAKKKLDTTATMNDSYYVRFIYCYIPAFALQSCYWFFDSALAFWPPVFYYILIRSALAFRPACFALDTLAWTLISAWTMIKSLLGSCFGNSRFGLFCFFTFSSFTLLHTSHFFALYLLYIPFLKIDLLDWGFFFFMMDMIVLG